MNRHLFLKAIDKVKKSSEFVDKLYELGIDVINCRYMNDEHFFFNKWMEECFGKEGADLIDWWLFESVEKKIYKEGSCSKELYEKDEELDGEVIADLTDIDDLYDYLLVNYKKKF